MLATKSLVELRGIAQSLGIVDLFQKDKPQLLQAIQLKQQALIPEPKIEIPRPEYDARLMDAMPSLRTNEVEIEEMLAPYIARGLRLTFTPEQWHMARGSKRDEGTIRMPLRTVLRCAEQMMK